MPRRLSRAKTRIEALTRCFLVGSDCAPVLVDQSAEDPVASDRGVEGDHSGGVVGRWVLAQALVRTQQRAHIGLRSFVRTRHRPALGDTQNQQEWPLTCIYRP